VAVVNQHIQAGASCFHDCPGLFNFKLKSNRADQTESNKPPVKSNKPPTKTGLYKANNENTKTQYLKFKHHENTKY
jgi:hypothetical protein